MAAYRVLDIETVPDLSSYTPNKNLKLARIPPSNDWAAVVAAAITSGTPHSELVWPAGVVEDEGFPPPQAQRVVAISWVDLSGDDNEWYFCQPDGCRSYCYINHDKPDEAERALLLKFSETQAKDDATLVTWNGRTFDLPVLNLRMLKYGIQWPWYYRERDVRYRYTESGHCDLMDVFSDYGAARSMKLGDVCRLIGLPGKKGDISGASVAEEVEKCRGALLDDIALVESKISTYCFQDSLQTAILFLRSRFHRGMIDVAHYNKALNTFRGSKSFFQDIDTETLKLKE